MSNFDRSSIDPLWTKERAEAAAEDGWALTYTIDSGKTSGCLMVHPHGPKLPDQYRAMKHVIGQAQAGSKLHVVAIRAMQASKVITTKAKTTRGKT